MNVSYAVIDNFVMRTSAVGVEQEWRRRANEMSAEYKLRELDYLENYLRKHGIKYERIDKYGEDYDRHQLIVYNDTGEIVWDAICNRGSYGYSEGLLEIYGTIVRPCGDSVEGWLTADDVIERIENE